MLKDINVENEFFQQRQKNVLFILFKYYGTIALFSKTEFLTRSERLVR